MSVRQQNSSTKSRENVTRANKNFKLKLAMDSFMKFNEQSANCSQPSTHASSDCMTKSKSYELDNTIDEDSKFQINLVNLSPSEKQENPFAFDESDLLKMHKSISKGKNYTL